MLEVSESRVSRVRGCDDRRRKAEDVARLLVRGFGEDDVLRNADSAVAHLVNSASRDTAEVAGARERDRDEAREEVACPRAAERHLIAHGVPLPRLERRDRLLCSAGCRLLPGNLRKSIGNKRKPLLVLARAPRADRDDDLHEARSLPDVGVTKTAFESAEGAL